MSTQNSRGQQIVLQIQKWIRTVIIGHNYCPFAKREVDNNKVRYQIITTQGLDDCLAAVIAECVYLDNHAETETTLLIFPEGLEHFDTFLDFLTLAEDMLLTKAYEGTYQLASFHPEYCFQGAEEADAANYTNRSPYPMLHLIREASLEKALEHYPSPEGIPERNIEFARSQGLEKMQRLLADSMNVDSQ